MNETVKDAIEAAAEGAAEGLIGVGAGKVAGAGAKVGGHWWQKLFPRNQGAFTGFWVCQHKYEHDVPDQDPTEITDTQIIEFTPKKKNKVTGITVAGKDIYHYQTIEGEIKHENILTGTWNAINQRYHGTFQFVINARGDKMTGKWLGHKGEKIFSGEYSLQKIQKPKDDNDLNKKMLHWEGKNLF